MTDTERKDRRRYRKVYTRLWRNEAFQALSAGDKVMTLYILTGPQANRIGLFLFSVGEASEDLAEPVSVVRKRVAVVCEAFGWEFDAKARVIWIPSWWTFNAPAEKANNFKGALTDLNDVPRSPLVARFCKNVVGIPAALHVLLGAWTPSEQCSGSVPNTVATQEQEQEQEKEQEKEQEQEMDGRSLLTLWNDTVRSLPKIEAMSSDRLKHAKARLRDNADFGYWAGVFRRMDASDFLTGRRPSKEHPHWRADVDFALKPGTAGKVLEGKYDNRMALAPTGTDGRGRTGVRRGQFEGVEEQD